MKMKLLGLLTGLAAVLMVVSCKKDKDNPKGLLGLWVENSAKKDTINVIEGENSGFVGPSLVLYTGGLAYFYTYTLNNTNDTIWLTNKTSSSTSQQNVPYKISISDKTFSIKKFHPGLPAGDPLTFNRVR